MEQIRAIFESRLESSKDIITSCGTGNNIFLFEFDVIVGVTASILFLGLEASGITSKKSLYDGSWTEYGTRHATDPDMIVKSK